MKSKRQPTAPPPSTATNTGDFTLYYRVFSESPDGMLIVAAEHFVVCNQAAAKLLGYQRPEQLVGLHPETISPARQPDGQASPCAPWVRHHGPVL